MCIDIRFQLKHTFDKNMKRERKEIMLQNTESLNQCFELIHIF